MIRGVTVRSPWSRPRPVILALPVLPIAATCKGLRWIIGQSPSAYLGEPPYNEGEVPFDAEVTFQAPP